MSETHLLILLNTCHSHDILIKNQSFSGKKGAIMAEKAQERTNRNKNKVTLRKGEQRRPNETYAYRWTDGHGKRRAVYAETLEELRIAEERIEKDRMDNIKAEAR